MKPNNLKSFFLTLGLFVFLFISFMPVNALAQTDRKVVESPELKTMLKGVWAKTPNGGPWVKIVVSNNSYSWFSAQPKDGEWVDWSNHNKNRTFVSFYKVSERNNYNGKFFTYYIAYTDEDINGKYTAFRIDIENGQQVLTVITKGDKPHYSSSTGKDLNAPFVTEGFKKKPANFNPWQ